ncbi:hypothetical protein BGZ75_006009 [Mortierella antarctica]|nr:hypothetical protein BGZ75_006009 [Mortierella antarctica]
MDGKPLKRMREGQETFAQQVVERDGIAIWRAWCLEQKFEDGDWITPEKLTAYVDGEITSREHNAIPTQSVVGSFVRPVLRLWGDQTAGKFSAASSDSGEHRLQAFSKQIQTLAKSSSVDLSASSSSSHSSASKSGLDRVEESVMSDLKRAQQDAKAKGVTGMLVDPLLVSLLQDQIRFIQALLAPAPLAHLGSGSSVSSIAPSPTHHHLSPSPVTPRPTARSKSHPSQKNKFVRFQADKIEVPVWYGKDRLTNLKPPRVYLMSPNVKTIQDVLVEWLEGFDGSPSIQELNTRYRAQWRDMDTAEQRVMNTRSCIVREFKRLVVEGGRTEKDALELMEKAASGLQLRTYADKLRTKLSERKRNQELAKASRGSTVPVNAGAGPQRSGNRNHKLDDGDKSSEDSVSESGRAAKSDQSFEENCIADSTPKTAARRNTIQTALRDARRLTTTKAKSPVFPFPVNDLENVSDIWQEWHKGWNGDPPLEQLIEQHGRAFYRDPFSQYKHMFYAKQKIVRTLDELIKDGFTEEEAIDKMEYYREGKRPQTLAAIIRDIDWTKPLPSNFQQHSTLQQQQGDAQEGSPQQQQPQQEQLQQEHQVTEHQPQEFQQQLRDNSHSDGGSFQGVHDGHDKLLALMDMTHADIRYEMDFSAERAKLEAVSDSTRSYE